MILAAGYDDGNAYYNWPEWWPYLGITNSVLPLSVFERGLVDYEAYDMGKVPFKVDVVASFLPGGSSANASAN